MFINKKTKKCCRHSAGSCFPLNHDAVTEIAFPPSSLPPLIMIISSPAKFVSFSKAAHTGYFPEVIKGEETREWGGLERED